MLSPRCLGRCGIVRCFFICKTHQKYKSGAAGVKISAGADESLVSNTYTDFGSTIADTLPLGTKYEIYTVRDNNGDETLNFRYTNELNDIIDIEVVGQAVTYNVYAGSGLHPWSEQPDTDRGSRCQQQQ